MIDSKLQINNAFIRQHLNMDDLKEYYCFPTRKYSGFQVYDESGDLVNYTRFGKNVLRDVFDIETFYLLKPHYSKESIKKTNVDFHVIWDITVDEFVILNRQGEEVLNLDATKTAATEILGLLNIKLRTFVAPTIRTKEHLQSQILLYNNLDLELPQNIPNIKKFIKDSQFTEIEFSYA